MADDFDPKAHTADEVKAALEEASEQEKNALVAAERQGKNRKSVLAAAGVDPDQRVDASGRVLHPWESAPKPQEN